MANIYTKLTDKTLILAPREALLRQFNFGTDWTEMRMGFFASGVTDSGDNTPVTVESLAASNASNRMAIGIKDSGLDLPGYGSSLFLGALTGTASTTASLDGSGPRFYCPGSTGNALSAAGYYGTTLVGGTATTDALANDVGLGVASAASAYNGVFLLKFVINNRGLSSQTVTMSTYTTDGVAGTDYSATALRTRLNNETYAGAKTIAWNDGAAARDIPDCIFVRLPLFSNRLRISAIRAIRYAP